MPTKPKPKGDQPANVLTPDQSAAHYFLTEIRTRITTQPLPYQYGVEKRALESLWEVFAQAREAMKKYPGCEKFAADTTQMLNMHLRPVTAKWHRALTEGRLDSRDGGDEFRSDLERVQAELRNFAKELHTMAYGKAGSDKLTPPALSKKEFDRCFLPLSFGIPLKLPTGTEQDDKINASERAEIGKRRAHFKVAEDENAIGLALSGGGIRSATFCLGVVQVLAGKGLLKFVDYLSTVSGGGYTGSFLTRRLGAGIAEQEVAWPLGPDPAPVRYLRQNAKYLAARSLKEGWGMATATLAGMVLNWAVPLLVLLIAAGLAMTFHRSFSGHQIWKHAAQIEGALVGLALIAYGALVRGGRRQSQVGGAILGSALALFLFTAAWKALDIGFYVLADWHSPTTKVVGAVVAALAAAAPTVIRFLPVLKDPQVRKIVLAVLLWVAALIVPLLAIAIFYAFWFLGSMKSIHITPHGICGCWALTIIAVILVIIDYLLDINRTGPHRLYRNALARTFVQTRDGEADLPLTDINPTHAAPYHLVNAALNIPSTTHPAVRDRRCDFFLFSKHWCGSPASNYHPTAHWHAGEQPVDLATAMAISGAAFSSYMGLGSMPTLTALLTFLNVRLGFWIGNPHRSILGHPGFTCLLREMLGVCMSEKGPWFNLSDGGHIENMAVYELLRRRCKFIVCVDGESDPDFTFEGLMTLVRHAQIDFGIRIDADLDDLRPNPTTGLTQTHSHFCRIYYPQANGHPAGIGLFLYLKLSVTGNESELIKRYRHNHPDFPHQTTLDQFFDQEQFEAYRELGVHAAEGLFSDALMNHAGDPKAFEEWFQRLASNLLTPENGG